MKYKDLIKLKKKDIITDRIIQPIQEDGTTWYSNGFIAIDEYYFRNHRYYAEWAVLVKEKKEKGGSLSPNIDKIIPDLSKCYEVKPSYVIDFNNDPATTFEDQNLWSVKVNPKFVSFMEECLVFRTRKNVAMQYKYMAIDGNNPIVIVVDNRAVGLIMPLRD